MQKAGRNKGRTGSNDEKRHESNQGRLPRLRHQSLPHPRKEIDVKESDRMLSKDVLNDKLQELEVLFKQTNIIKQDVDQNKGIICSEFNQLSNMFTHFGDLINNYGSSSNDINKQLSKLTELHDRSFKEGKEQVEFKVSLNDEEIDKSITFIKLLNNLLQELSYLKMYDNKKSRSIKKANEFKELFSGALYLFIKGIYQCWYKLIEIIAGREMDSNKLNELLSSSVDFKECNEYISKINVLLKDMKHDGITIGDNYYWWRFWKDNIV